MSLRTRFWLQGLGAAFFAAVAIAEAVGLKNPAFGAGWSPFIAAAACAVMVYEAWRTWKKQKAE